MSEPQRFEIVTVAGQFYTPAVLTCCGWSRTTQTRSYKMIFMKNKMTVLCMAWLTLLNCSLAFAKESPASAEQLQSQFEAALKGKDKATILSLYHWDDVSERMKSFESELTEKMLK